MKSYMQSQARLLFLSLLLSTAASAASRPGRRLPSAELYLGLGHTQPVTAIAWSLDGKTLATGSRDHTVILWDVASRRPRATLAGYIGHEMGSFWYAPPI